MKSKIPTAAEIVNARKVIMAQYPGLKSPPEAVMECWTGIGWHKAEVLYGILVGLEIAKNRADKKKKLS